MIDVLGLTKTLGLKYVLRVLDFSVERDEFVAMVGPNGAGKTKLLRIVASLAIPTAGLVRAAGSWLPAEARQVRGRRTADRQDHSHGSDHRSVPDLRRNGHVLPARLTRPVET